MLVGLGGDIGVYAFQRAAHELFGWTPVALQKNTTTFLRYSELATRVIEPDIHNPDTLVARLNQFAAEHPDHELLLFTNLDWHVRVLAQLRDRIDPRWLMPFCDLATFDLVSDKRSFAELSAKVGIRTPLTVAAGFTEASIGADAEGGPVLSVADSLVALRDSGVAYPIIGKPSVSADWFEVSFPGKRKIHHFESESEVAEVLGHLQAAAYPSEFLLQEFVPGDETHMRSLTAYRDTKGKITLLAGGQVLLEEHTPGTMGIPAAILTRVDEDAFAAAARFLVAADYYGFANFDYKVSSRTGENVFFEVNPRIGRNNFYVTAAGANVAAVVANDLLPDHAATAPTPPVTPAGEILYSVAPYRLLLRYLLDPQLKATVVAAKKRSGLFHPLRYRGDAGLKRRAYVNALGVRLALKYREYYPKPTESGF
jgi:D-aspartate ligase